MNKRRPKIGVALGTGAARGFAHIGVLKVLEREGIPVDFLAGSSIGALVASCYAAGMSLAEMEKRASELNPKQIRSYFSPSFTRHGIAHGRTIEDYLKGVMGDVQFSNLKIPLSIMCADLVTGKEVILREGSVVKAVRASISMPVIFTPVKYNKTFLVDGGLVDPIPVGPVSKMGADIIIAVDVTRDIEKSFMMKKNLKLDKTRSFFSRWKKSKPSKDEDWTPGMLQVLLHTIKIVEAKIAELQLSQEKVDVLIKPPVDHIFFLEFRKGKELVELGEKAATEALPLIREKIRQFG